MSTLSFQVVGAKKEVLDFEQFHKFYNLLMFESQNTVSMQFSCAEKFGIGTILKSRRSKKYSKTVILWNIITI